MIGASEPRSGDREAAETSCDAAEIACDGDDVACDAGVDFGDAEVERVIGGEGGSSTSRTENKFAEEIRP
jgi:hypothetical protein